jgi:hypothetical protein
LSVSESSHQKLAILFKDVLKKKKKKVMEIKMELNKNMRIRKWKRTRTRETGKEIEKNKRN